MAVTLNGCNDSLKAQVININESDKPLWNNLQYTSYTLKAIEKYGQNLIAVNPINIRKFCSNYIYLNNHQKKDFWVYLISSISKLESNHKHI